MFHLRFCCLPHACVPLSGTCGPRERGASAGSRHASTSPRLPVAEAAVTRAAPGGAEPRGGLVLFICYLEPGGWKIPATPTRNHHTDLPRTRSRTSRKSSTCPHAASSTTACAPLRHLANQTLPLQK